MGRNGKEVSGRPQRRGEGDRRPARKRTRPKNKNKKLTTRELLTHTQRKEREENEE